MGQTKLRSSASASGQQQSFLYDCTTVPPPRFSDLPTVLNSTYHRSHWGWQGWAWSRVEAGVHHCCWPIVTSIIRDTITGMPSQWRGRWWPRWWQRLLLLWHWGRGRNRGYGAVKLIFKGPILWDELLSKNLGKSRLNQDFGYFWHIFWDFLK